MPECFPKWLYHLTFPPAVYEHFSFSTTLSTLAIICLFCYSHPSECEGCEMVCISAFALSFLHGEWYLASLYVLIGHCIYSRNISIQIFHSFLIGLFIFSLLYYKMSVYFWYKSFIRYMIWQYLHLFCMSFFHFLGDIKIFSTKIFNFQVVQLISFFSFVVYAFGVLFKNHYLFQSHKNIKLCFLLRVLILIFINLALDPLPFPYVF